MPRRAVVISFDHLHTGYLGCYGNEWIETPSLDRLASEAVVFDRHFAENLGDTGGLHAWWSGRYEALRAPGDDRARWGLIDVLGRAGVRTWLVAESCGGPEAAVAPPFDEITTAVGTDSLDVEETEIPFAKAIDALIERLPTLFSGDAPSLVWLKSRGVPSPWLPPRGFAELYLEEFGLGGDTPDEDALEAAEPVKEPAAEDARMELRYAKALYAAYVTTLDRWLGKLLGRLAQQPAWSETLLVVTAARGESLGEHVRLDATSPVLREEFVHTPMIVRLPDRQFDALRCPALVQPVDVAPTLVEWLVAPPGGAPLPAAAVSLSESSFEGGSLLPLARCERREIRRDALIAAGAEWGLRTDQFLFVEPARPEAGEPLLFEKPNDRWDHSDMSAQYADIVDALHDQLTRRRGAQTFKDCIGLRGQRPDDTSTAP